MKKIDQAFSADSISAASVSPSSFAVSTVDISVTGSISPTVCVTTLNSTVDLNKISTSDLPTTTISHTSTQESTVLPYPERPYPNTPDHIIISSSERCSIDSFIDQYVKTRAVQPDAELRNEVIEALRAFSCTAPVMLYEMNAWLDSRLGLKVLHPDYLDIIDEYGDFHRRNEASQPLDHAAQMLPSTAAR